LGQEHQRLTEDLKREREERLEAQRQAERQEQERSRLERELRRSQAELDSQRQPPARDQTEKSEARPPWWRRPILVVGLLFGALAAWLTSLVVALNLLAP
jgi:ferric-dicitrate binding protein FerR (iron transport regulator)